MNNVDELAVMLDKVIKELSDLRDRLEVIRDEAETILSDVNDAADSLEYAQEALSRQL